MVILKKFNSSKTKKSVISENGIIPDMNRMNDVSTIAIVVDGEVVDIMRAQPKLTSILLATPTFAKVQPDLAVKIGDKYSDGKFTSTAPLIQDISPKEFILGDKS
jgi:hypothetical protein